AGGTIPAYACPHPSRVNGGCGHCSIIAERLESHVVDTVGEWLASPELVALTAAHLDAGRDDGLAAARAELDDVDAKMAALAAQWAAGEVTDVERAAARRVLDDRRRALVDRLGAAVPGRRGLSVAEARDAW